MCEWLDRNELYSSTPSNKKELPPLSANTDSGTCIEFLCSERELVEEFDSDKNLVREASCQRIIDEGFLLTVLLA